VTVPSGTVEFSNQAPPTETATAVSVTQDGKTASLSIRKIGDTGPVRVGDTINYLITISNAGTIRLTGVNVSDLTIGIERAPISGKSGVGILQPGESVTVGGSYRVKEQDRPGPVVNTATADSDQTPAVSDSHTVPIGIPQGENNLTQVTDQLGWVPVRACERACVMWQLYQTNQTGDWEVFRLEEAGNVSTINVSQGVGTDDISPSRSPNGEWVAFSSNRDGNWEIYVVSADGSQPQRMTFSAYANNINPTWGPNNLIVFQSNRNGNWDLFMVDVTTGAETQLTNTPTDELNPAWSPDGSRVVYQGNQDDLWQIYALIPQTDFVSRLSNGLHADFEPNFSPDGGFIAFQAQFEDRPNSVIYMMTSDGANAWVISDEAGNASNPVWSSDGTLLAYQSDLDGDQDIYIYSVADGQVRQLTQNNVDDYAPAWRCDRAALLFNSDISGNPDIYEAEALPLDAPAIDVMAEARQLTNHEADDLYPLDESEKEYGSNESGLSSSPGIMPLPSDGTYPTFPTIGLAVGASEPSYPRMIPWIPVNACQGTCPTWTLYASRETGNWEIYRLDEESSSAVSVNVSRGFGEEIDDLMPTRSPNGDWVAFASNRAGNWEIYIADSAGLLPARRMTYSDEAEERNPIWSPSGTTIVYESQRDGNWELYRVNILNGLEERLTFNPGDDVHPNWSPDGSRLIFQSNRDGLWQIFSLDLASNVATRLSDKRGNDYEPSFSPNGRYIVFRSVRGTNPNSIIYGMNADGTGVIPLSDANGNASDPVWSSSGTEIAYQSNLNGNLDIFIYSNGGTRQLTSGSGNHYGPQWRCDSDEILFSSDVTGTPNLFIASALPLDAGPIQVMTGARQLTFATGANGVAMNGDVLLEVGG
jgi:uncharacterized repeat protein (TIGR01451 family)